MNRLQHGVVRRICGSAFIVASLVLSGAFPRLAFADEPLLGSVTIVQSTPANPSQAFGYSSNVPEMMTQFYLDQDPTTYPQPWVTSLYVTPGQYLVSQEPHEGWRISDIECTDPDGNSSGDVSNRSATIRMDAGEEIHCTFTNAPRSATSTSTRRRFPRTRRAFSTAATSAPLASPMTATRAALTGRGATSARRA